MLQPEVIGFPGALGIRNCRLAQATGAVDVVLLPRSGSVKIVLVEAKVGSSPDASSKVVGQLLMYYAGALSLGAQGVELLREFAEQDARAARSPTVKSSKRLTGGFLSREAAFQALSRGKPLRPEEIRLYIGLEGSVHRGLGPTLEILQEHHDLSIGVVLVRSGQLALARSAA